MSLKTHFVQFYRQLDDGETCGCGEGGAEFLVGLMLTKIAICLKGAQEGIYPTVCSSEVDAILCVSRHLKVGDQIIRVFVTQWTGLWRILAALVTRRLAVRRLKLPDSLKGMINDAADFFEETSWISNPLDRIANKVAQFVILHRDVT